MRTMLKSKIHRARVTCCNVDYEGSIAIDRALLEEADILPYERVEVLNINNGARFSTYAIEADRGSGVISLNGAAARLVARDDIVLILTYVQIPEDETINYHPKLVYVNSKNRVIEKHGEKEAAKDLMSAL
ncbi:aspartate 1-decarboxylase [Chloroflexota bacterium]